VVAAVVTGGVTRRAFLGAAGAGALLAAGCGAPEEPPPDAELLAPSLAAALALASAYERLGGRLGRELAAVEREHADRLRAAGARHGAAQPAATGGALEAAMSLERTAMRANVDATGLVRDLRTRLLTAELLSEDAQHVSALLAQAHRDPLPNAFPDGLRA
jgi:hypothetical protein